MTMDELFGNLPAFERGTVWLTGAGPGDPGLLTLLAVKALREADHIVYDALVDESCLKIARTGAVLEYAGKRGGKPSPKQRDISLRLVELARTGKRVLRLKGGDPFVFGRGIGGLAYAGIPVTHRQITHVVTFLTGHDSSGLVPDRIDWASIAKGSPVIVMYMAMKHIGEIARNLMGAGRSASEPVAFVCNAATGNQTVLETTLGAAAADMAASGLEPPAIVVVGEVVRLRGGLDWLGALGGRTLVADPLGTEGLRDPA
jgi:uroporphyrin-III C-methyltransferase